MTSLGLRSGLRPGKTTSKLLEKVSKQLRGDYAGKGTGASDSDLNGEDDDDGVSSYLKMLSEKTAKQSEKTEAGDGSDGELTKANPVKSAATVGANRFLKKPSTPTAAEKQASTVSSAKTELNKGSGKAVENSPTLHRVEAFTKKYGRSSKISEPEPTSDSDLDLSLSMDEDILADVKELKKNRPASSVDSVASLKSSAKSLPKKSKKSPKNNDEEDSGSMKIGRSGNRFLKTPVTDPDVKGPEKTSQEMKKVESPAKGKQRSSLFKLESAARHSTEVVLDSDEESLAEFIGGLSGSSSGRKTPSRTKSKESMKSSFHVKQKDDETDDHLDKSISEAEPDSFKFNLRDIESLQDLTKTSEVHKNSRSVTPQKNNKVDEFRSAKGRDVRERSKSLQRKREQPDDVLSQFGLQSVDDLLGTTNDDYVEPLPISEVQYESDFDFVPNTSRGISPMPLRSILSPTPRSMTPRSSRSRVRLMDELTEIRSRSPSPETPKSASHASGLTRSETVRTVTDSESEVERTIRTIDESHTKGNTSDGSDTEETSTVKTLSDGDSVSSFDRMSATRRSRRRIPRRSSSSRRSSTASERLYSDDFTTTSPGSESQSTSRRSSFTDDLDSQRSMSESTESKDRSRHITRKVKTRDSEVQTGLDVGLHYHWVNDLASEAWVSSQYRQAFSDPAKVATSVVSAEALDALTNFSPATLALNDMLRQQLQLTTQFMTVHRRLHYSLIQSLDSPAYKYTTLKETKEFIRKHSRPVASFEETLKQVKQEMGIV